MSFPVWDIQKLFPLVKSAVCHNLSALTCNSSIVEIANVLVTIFVDLAPDSMFLAAVEGTILYTSVGIDGFGISFVFQEVWND